LIIDDRSYPEISHSVLSFSRTFVADHPQAVRDFLDAVERAVIEINTDKDAWNTILRDNNLIPPPLMESYTLPDYPLASVPSEAQFMDALAWVQEAGLVEGEIKYNEAVDGSYLP
jgi:NitT/TauT family transport system substrate-binding protein